MDDMPLSQASATADDDFCNGLPRLPHGNLTTITKAMEESLGQALRTIPLMNCRAGVPVERCTPQGMLLQVAAVAGVEWWNALFPSTPLPNEVIDAVPLALFWASTLVRRIVITDTEEWTTAAYRCKTADLHTMAHSPSSPPPAVVALIIAILGAAWNKQRVGTNNELRDKTHPMVGLWQAPHEKRAMLQLPPKKFQEKCQTGIVGEGCGQGWCQSMDAFWLFLSYKAKPTTTRRTRRRTRTRTRT